MFFKKELFTIKLLRSFHIIGRKIRNQFKEKNGVIKYSESISFFYIYIIPQSLTKVNTFTPFYLLGVNKIN